MLEQAKLVSIIREVQVDNVLSVMDALVEEGIRWFEISLSDGENRMKRCIQTQCMWEPEQSQQKSR